MAKWPEERYSTCGELADAARTALASSAEKPERAAPVEPPPPDTIEVQPASLAEPSRKTITKRQRASLAAVGLVVVVGGLLAGSIWLTGSGTSTPPSAAPAPAAAAPPALVEAAPPAEPSPPTEPTSQSVSSEPPPAPAEVPAGDGSPGLLASLRGGALVRIDGRTGEILARVAIPGGGLLASDRSSVWVSGGGRNQHLLVRVEEATNTVTDVFDADVGSYGGPSWLAAAGRSAWISGYDYGRLYRFEPGTSAAELVDDVGLFYWPVAAAGSIWGGGFDASTLLRVDPDTRRIVARVGGVGRVAVAGDGFLWAWWVERHGLARVDTRTNEITGALEVAGRWDEFAVADGAVWASSANGAIARLDPETGAEQERIRLWRTPRALVQETGVWVPLAAGAGAVWAGNQLDSSVARYDLATGRVETIDVDGVPSDLVVARGSVWVAVDTRALELYRGAVEALCKAAHASLDREVLASGITAPPWSEGGFAAYDQAARRIIAETLPKLRALTPPEELQEQFDHLYGLMQQYAEGRDAAWIHTVEQERSLYDCTFSLPR